MALQYKDECKKQLSHQAQMYWFLYKRAFQAYHDGDKSDCRYQCRQLIQDARLPDQIRCSTYHLLACCAPRSKIKYWLDHALNVIVQIEDEEGKEEHEIERELASFLRGKNSAYHKLFGVEEDVGKGDEETLPDAPSDSEQTEATKTDDPMTDAPLLSESTLATEFSSNLGLHVRPKQSNLVIRSGSSEPSSSLFDRAFPSSSPTRALFPLRSDTAHPLHIGEPLQHEGEVQSAEETESGGSGEGNEGEDDDIQ